MTDAVATSPEARRRFYFGLIPGVLFSPRKTFAQISAFTKDVWLTPLVVLSLTAVLLIAISGPVRIQAAQSGMTMPPDFQYWSQEQQAQYQQASQATQGTVFIYALPAIVALGKIWLGWLIVGGLLHLVLTLLGGRGNTSSAMNIVAWGSLPFAVRDLVQAAFIWSNKTLISGDGLAGFAPTGEGYWFAALAGLLSLIDIYLIWQIVLVAIGVRSANGLTPAKAWGGTLVTLLFVLALQALLMGTSGLMSGLTVVRPFFF